MNFPDAPDAAELRYLRADILYFKLGKYEDAGREYLAVGRTQPVGKHHKDALLQAMGAFEKVRKPGAAGGGKREITESDRLFGEAADLYATLFPNDKEIVTVIYKNGQFFFDYGDYDEAVKRFGLIVERYPDDPNAGAAGDRILQALNKAKDYENIESWARRLKKTKAFAPRDEQERLDKLIVGVVMKSGEKYAAEGKYDKTAAFFLRVPHEYPQNGFAPKALNNAGAVMETDALDRTGQDQDLARRRQGGCGRASREDDQADHEHPAPTEPVAERGARQEQDRERQRVRVDHPLEVGEAGAEVAPDDGQRGRDDQVVERDHEERDG